MRQETGGWDWMTYCAPTVCMRVRISWTQFIYFKRTEQNGANDFESAEWGSPLERGSWHVTMWLSFTPPLANIHAATQMKIKSGHFRNTGAFSWLASDHYMETLQTKDRQILFCFALVLLSQLRCVGLQTNSTCDNCDLPRPRGSLCLLISSQRLVWPGGLDFTASLSSFILEHAHLECRVFYNCQILGAKFSLYLLSLVCS